MEAEGAGRSRADWLARTVAFLSFFVSAITLYCTVLRPAVVQIGVGQHVLLNAKPRIGVLCTLANEGAQQTLMTSASLEWDSTVFRLAMISTTLEQWEYDSKGRWNTKVPTLYTLASPIAVRGRDHSTAILWFTSDQPFAFRSGRHSAVLKVLNGPEVIAQKEFHFVLKDSDISALVGHPTAEFAIEVNQQ